MEERDRVRREKEREKERERKREKERGKERENSSLGYSSKLLKGHQYCTQHVSPYLVTLIVI